MEVSPEGMWRVAESGYPWSTLEQDSPPEPLLKVSSTPHLDLLLVNQCMPAPDGPGNG